MAGPRGAGPQRVRSFAGGIIGDDDACSTSASSGGCREGEGGETKAETVEELPSGAGLRARWALYAEGRGLCGGLRRRL